MDQQQSSKPRKHNNRVTAEPKTTDQSASSSNQSKGNTVIGDHNTVNQAKYNVEKGDLHVIESVVVNAASYHG